MKLGLKWIETQKKDQELLINTKLDSLAPLIVRESDLKNNNNNNKTDQHFSSCSAYFP